MLVVLEDVYVQGVFFFLPYPNNRKSQPAIAPTAQFRAWPRSPRNFFIVPYGRRQVHLLALVYPGKKEGPEERATVEETPKKEAGDSWTEGRLYIPRLHPASPLNRHTQANHHWPIPSPPGLSHTKLGGSGSPMQLPAFQLDQVAAWFVGNDEGAPYSPSGRAGEIRVQDGEEDGESYGADRGLTGAGFCRNFPGATAPQQTIFTGSRARVREGRLGLQSKQWRSRVRAQAAQRAG